MTPGLAFFYGGLVGRKNVLAIMIQSYVSMGWTTVLERETEQQHLSPRFKELLERFLPRKVDTASKLPAA